MRRAAHAQRRVRHVDLDIVPAARVRGGARRAVVAPEQRLPGEGLPLSRRGTGPTAWSRTSSGGGSTCARPAPGGARRPRTELVFVSLENGIDTAWLHGKLADAVAPA